MRILIYFALLFSMILVSCGSLNKSIPIETTEVSFTQEIQNFREAKKQEFRESEHAPLKGKEIEYMRFFDPNPEYKVVAQITRIDNPESITIKTSAGEERQYIPYATLDFELKGKTHQLIVHTSMRFIQSEEYKNLLFLMFYDDTNGEETYGGGRYIDLSKEDIVDDKITVDFNKCYHPYCHYSSGYSCSIPPKDNYISTKILVGEKNYAGEYKGEH